MTASGLVRGQQLPAVDAMIAAHLRAGEFAPALGLAQSVNDPPVRDALLARIAIAQAEAGARQAAVDTLASISDPQLRTSSARQLREMPVGLEARGGGGLADFAPLIDLIKATVAPTTWDDVGGPGAIDGFEGGVAVDARGEMRKIATDGAARLVAARAAAARVTGGGDPRRLSALRKVSLARLEREVLLRWAEGAPPTEAMQVLAGLQRVQMLFVYPESGDLVLAGPAGDWTTDREGRLVSRDTGRPLVQLDDFVVLLRNAVEGEGRFGCSITPVRERLAATRAFLEESAKRSIPESGRARWLAQVRDHLGKQEITVYGVDPQTRVGRILVEADYRMKLVGMGLEESVAGVPDYLSRIVVGPGESPPPMDVLRWWFTLNYDAVETTPARDAFALRGQGVKVLSENEMITAGGDRVHTGRTDDLNREFAHDFTRHFEALAAKYPIYAELQNVFDLALFAAVIRAEELPSRVGWRAKFFLDEAGYQPQRETAPTEVETVINHRVIQRRHIVAGISGGVTVDARPLARREAVAVQRDGRLAGQRPQSAAPANLPPRAWWWD